jgi:site-specific recombinase XerD
MTDRTQAEPHPDFVVFADSWDLSLQADGYADNTRRGYGKALARLAGWLAEHHPGVGPADVTREHVRGFIVATREATSSSTARSFFAGLRHFFRWALAEQEVATDPTEGIRTPKPNDQRTPLIDHDDIRALIADCAGREFRNRRDAAIVYLFADGGLRLSELSELGVDDVDVRERIVYVKGKGTNRSGPRHRAVPVGVRTAQALDRYLRERRKHPYAETSSLWLGDRGRPRLSRYGVDAMIERRCQRLGLSIHPHQFRHTWADAFRAAGGTEGDLMTLGGWRGRAMLDRYGRTNATGRAKEAYRRLSFGDRL